MARLTVLGVGNILMQDDAVGVRLMEALRDGRCWGDDVEFIDGGAGGLNLLGVIERASRLVVLDAADMHQPPGTVQVVSIEQVVDDGSPGRLSLHEVPLVETLRLCRQFLRCPPTVIFAIQPGAVGHGRGLGPPLQAAMPELTRQAAELVRRELALALQDATTEND